MSVDNAMSIDGLTTIPSNLGPKETMDHLDAEVRAMGMRVFARINDQNQAGADRVGASANDHSRFKSETAHVTRKAPPLLAF